MHSPAVVAQQGCMHAQQNAQGRAVHKGNARPDWEHWARCSCSGGVGCRCIPSLLVTWTDRIEAVERNNFYKKGRLAAPASHSSPGWGLKCAAPVEPAGPPLLLAVPARRLLLLPGRVLQHWLPGWCHHWARQQELLGPAAERGTGRRGGCWQRLPVVARW